MSQPQSEIQLYLPTTLDTKINLKASKIDNNLDINIKNQVETKYGNKFFNFGHVRPGTIRILKRSIGNKIGSSDFTGDISFHVIFQCEVYLPQIGQEIDARVKSINKIGILAKSDSNKLTILLSKPHQSNLELFSEVMLETRVRIRIVEFKIDSQNETIVIIGDLVRILSGVYQNYQMPRIDGMVIDVNGDMQLTSSIRNLYIDYGDFVDSVNSKSLLDPYAMFIPENMDEKTFDKMRHKVSWDGFKNYWSSVRSMIEDYELVYATGGYNGNQGIAKLPFKAQPISRAFFKLWELLYRYPEIVKRLNSDNNLVILNLGEAPGGFIQSINHYRFKEYSKSNDTYYAYSLKIDKATGLSWENPITKKELGRFDNKYNLHYGDLTKPTDLDNILADMKGKQADLITADGAYTHSKVYNYEEIVNYKIFYGEIVAAILNQKMGGSFVLKIFDTLTFVTRQLLILLNHYYSEVFITKPDFSRPASSEKYVICLGFKGIDTMNQNLESLKKTCFELFDLWNEKVIEKMNIFYPDNENFLLNLLSYSISEDDDFAKKLQDITQDHITKQSEHINKGIHLIHTKSIFDVRKVEEIKQNQIKQAINWCQRYKLEYNEDINLTKEHFSETEIVNTSKTIMFSINKLLSEYKDSFDYLNDEYPYVNMEYLSERSLSMNRLLEKIYDDFQQSQVYEFKVSRLNPTPALNGELHFKDGPKSQRWYVIYELLNNLPIFDSSSKTIKAFINLDNITGDATQALSYYTSIKTKKNLEWVGNMIFPATDPIGWLTVNKDKFLIGENGKMSGDLREIETLEYLFKYFGDKKDDKKVDFYLSDFNIPLPDENYGILVLYPERYFMKDYFGQIIAGLISLKDGGKMLIRQYSFFEKETIGMIALLENVFEEVTIIKPLIGQIESVEVYLFANNFKIKKFTETMRNDLFNFMNDAFAETREEMMTSDYVMPKIPESVTFKSDDLEQRLVYIGYRIYVLNQFPRLQVNLDLYENAKYQLNSQQEASVEHILGEKEEIVNKGELSQNDKSEIINLDKKLEEVFSEITDKIVNKDFRYLLEETVTNWLEKNNPMK